MLKLRRQQPTQVMGGGNPPQEKGKDGYSNKDSSKEGRDNDPRDPIKFPSHYRREEEDRFTVYLKYSHEHQKVFWWGYRNANKLEKDSVSRTRGGTVQMWGDFFPYCDNVEKDAKCSTSSEGNKEEIKAMVISPDPDNKYLSCGVMNYGKSTLEGSCVVDKNLNELINFKKGQNFKLAFTYMPDTNIANIIQEYIGDAKEAKIYKPATNSFSYGVTYETLELLGEKFICDFVLSFTKLIEVNPGMKMKFDYLQSTCPNPIEKCVPYLVPDQVPDISKLDSSKFPTTIEEVTKDWKELNKGKSCDLLIHGDSHLEQRPTGHFFYTDTKNFPKYLYSEETEEFKPITIEEFVEAARKEAKKESERKMTEEERQKIRNIYNK